MNGWEKRKKKHSKPKARRGSIRLGIEHSSSSWSENFTLKKKKKVASCTNNSMRMQYSVYVCMCVCIFYIITWRSCCKTQLHPQTSIQMISHDMPCRRRCQKIPHICDYKSQIPRQNAISNSIINNRPFLFIPCFSFLFDIIKKKKDITIVQSFLSCSGHIGHG